MSNEKLSGLEALLHLQPSTGQQGSFTESVDAERASANLDLLRERRKGIPEVVLAEGKTAAQVVAIVTLFLDHTGRAIISRIQPALVETLREHFAASYRITQYAAARAMVITKSSFSRPSTGGQVGILSAGTSDVPVAEEARVIAEEMGCAVYTAYDVGVAGLHRLVVPLQTMLAKGVDAVIVAAGMDGALPSVISGLIDVPVIGLPTSTGYGLGGGGLGAILAMLQTCAPGMTVVNIDNGVNAGATAALIANRVARIRGGSCD